MKTFLPALFVSLAFLATSFAEAVKIPPEVRKAVQAPAKFHEIRKVADLPAGVLKALASGGNIMANPGEDWQVTDVIDPGKSLPGRRLLWAASDGAHCVIHYETGGIAHVFHTAVAELEPGKTAARILWEDAGRPRKEFENWASFLEFLGKK